MAFTDVKETFEQLHKNFQPEVAGDIDAVFQWELLGDAGGNWHMIVKDGACELVEGKHPSPAVSQTSTAEVFLAMVNNELNPMAAFMSGKLKVKGNMLLAQKITEIWPA